MELYYKNRLKLVNKEILRFNISKTKNTKQIIVDVYLWDNDQDFIDTRDDNFYKNNKADKTVGDFQLFKGNGKEFGRINLMKQYLTIGDIVHEVHHLTHFLFYRLNKSIGIKNEEELAEWNGQLVSILFDAYKGYIHSQDVALQILDEMGELYDEEPSKQLQLI
jgi:hypothetical protein